MPTKLTVFNDVCGLLLLAPMSSDLDAGEKGAILRTHWDSAVAMAHEKTAWDFAKEFAKLPRLSETPPFGYDYYYAVPADCLRILYVSRTGEPQDSLIWREGAPGKIATDADTVYLTYVGSDSVTKVGRWSESFAHYVATELAVKSLKLNPAAKDDVVRERKKALSDAVGLDAAQGPSVLRPMGSWSRAARGYIVHGNTREQGL